MDSQLLTELTSIIRGDVLTDATTLATYSHDASLFEVKPQVVVYPKDEKDVQNLMIFVAKHKKNHPELSVTGRAAGTDMGGGSINASIIVAFGKYFNHTPQVNGNIATSQPGVFYRDFEKETLKSNLIFPSYPASRELCAIGGIVNNNSGGEKSLQYGKTEKYVKRVKVVLSDGSIAEFKPLHEKQLQLKMREKTLEGKIYKELFSLVSENYDVLKKAKPTVSKNSAGYSLWNIYDKETGIFDITKLWVGAQGTLGLLLEADIALVPVHKHREMMVIFLQDMSHLGQIVDAVLPLKPESFESYDDNTLKIALKFFPEFAKKLGLRGLISSGFAFMPAFLEMLIGRLPKLILQIDFTGDDPEELKQKIIALKETLQPLHPQTRIAIEDQENRYWLVRRESFNLLRNKVRGLHTAPFIDDFVIHPKDIASVIPQITDILKQHPEFIFTVAAHIGDGNFHIIPLVDIQNPKVRTLIPIVEKKVYDIVVKNGGSITGEHNDGLIRSPFLSSMYDKKTIELFERTKEIFDPLHICNPGKKVYSSLKFAMDHIRTEY